jgi:hypothetical protein
MLKHEASAKCLYIAILLTAQWHRRMLIVMSDLKFDLEDDLSVSDLRKVDEWEPRLSEAGKLRLQRRGEVLGVLLSPRAWRALKEQTERYEQVLRLIEDERDRRIIAQREADPLLRGEELRDALGQELKKTGLL